MIKRLAGRTVVVTRAVGQISSFQALLEKKGAKVILCPAIATKPIPPNSHIRSVLAALRRDSRAFDWVIFFSENGVRFFKRLLKSAPLHSRIAVVGPRTAEAVRSSGWRVSRMAEEFSGRGLLKVLKPAKGQRWLIPCVEGGGKDVFRKLFQSGAAVQELKIYRTVPAPPPSGRIKKCIVDRSDVVAFTSGSTAVNFFRFFSKREKEKIAKRSLALSIGPSTTKSLRAVSFRNILQAPRSTIKSMVEVLCDHYQT